MVKALACCLCLVLLANACGAATAQPTPRPAPTATAKPNITASAPASLAATATALLIVPSTVLSGHTDLVGQLAWSPDGQLLASSAGRFDTHPLTDLSIRLWRPDGTPVAVLTGHTQRVTALTWSPDGQTLASGSLDGTILASGSIVTFPHPTVQWWNGAGQIIQTLSTEGSGGKFYNLAWSPDGRYLVGGATDYKEWEASGQLVGTAGYPGGTPSWGLAWSLDSQRWAIGDESGRVEIHSNLGAVITTLVDTSGVDVLAWSPDSRVLTDGGRLWQADGSIVASLGSTAREVNAVAWSPDGQILAVGGNDDMVLLWRADGTQLGTLAGHTGPIEALAWRPKGHLLATASADHTIRLWQIE